MNMVWLGRERQNSNVVALSNGVDNLLKFVFNIVDQNRFSVFRYPNKMIVQVVFTPSSFSQLHTNHPIQLYYIL